MEKKIIPAIIAKNQEELNQSLKKVMPYVDLIQLDIMDSQFVPNTSLFFDFELPQKLCTYEAHLMVQDPLSWIQKHGEKVDTILVHAESQFNPEKILQYSKNYNKKIGYVLNPETKLSALEQLLPHIDQVLIMTVNPGFYGSPFLPEMMKKITQLRQHNPKIDIEVDGGITDKTIQLVDHAGANMFVSGSYIIKSSNVESAIQTLKHLVVKK